MNKKAGITLIALIITIIIMLILVAVTISMAVNGGLFGYAGNAVKGTQAEKEKEQNWIDVNGMTTDQLIAKYTSNPELDLAKLREYFVGKGWEDWFENVYDETEECWVNRYKNDEIISDASTRIMELGGYDNYDIIKYKGNYYMLTFDENGEIVLAVDVAPIDVMVLALGRDVIWDGDTICYYSFQGKKYRVTFDENGEPVSVEQIDSIPTDVPLYLKGRDYSRGERSFWLCGELNGEEFHDDILPSYNPEIEINHSGTRYSVIDYIIDGMSEIDLGLPSAWEFLTHNLNVSSGDIITLYINMNGTVLSTDLTCK